MSAETVTSSPVGRSTLTSPTLRRAFHVRLVAVVVALVAVGLLIDRLVASAVEDLAVSQVRALSATTAANLRDWFTKRRELATVLASHPDVREAALPILAGDARGAEHLRTLLLGFAEQFEIESFSVCAPDGKIVFAKEGVSPGMHVAHEYEDEVRRSLAGESTISAPETHAFRGAEGLAITATAPVADGADVRGVLSLRFEPRGGYMRLFESARPGDTGETYAVDAQGRLASRSRFFAELRDAGLAAPRDDTAMLLIDLRDPGKRLVDAAGVDRGSLPLTLPVREVTAGREGFDADGHRDYRGVPVVSAWTPVPEFGLGVVTQMDVAEAFRPLRRLRVVFASLTLLLGAAGVVAVVMMRKSEISARRVEKAEQKLRELGQYNLERKLGEGGMGAVYLATHRVLRRKTAVKLMRRETSPDAVRRFEREARITCSLTHPNTVSVYDYGAAQDGTLYLAMEFLRGKDMDRIVRDHGPLPPARAIHFLAQTAGSLAEAHAAGLVHRDVKPANLFVCERGGILDFVKVLDFGVAKRTSPDAGETSPEMLSGTPLYMSPECGLGAGEPDGRADLYSLGCVAWFLLTGKPVYERKTVMEVLMAHLQAPVPPLRDAAPSPVPADLERIVLRLLAKSPSDRIDGAAHLLVELQACADWGRWTQDDARAWWARHPLPEPTAADAAPEAPARAAESDPKILTLHGTV
jgi:tRNA A-37 threonylcarbamoyl transferase component Bud32